MDLPYRIMRKAYHFLKKVYGEEKSHNFYMFFFGVIEYVRIQGYCLRYRFVTKSVSKPDEAKKIAFILPWYGQGVVGGAEAATFDLTQALLLENPDYEIEVLTTTLREFSVDWNAAFHPEGLKYENGITVRRFHAAVRNRNVFHYLNGTQLMPGGTESLKHIAPGRQRSPIPWWAEYFYLRNMIDSPALFRYLIQEAHRYRYCIFVPYMFTSSVVGSLILGRKALVMPCLHDERYAYMGIFRRAFRKVSGMLCLVRSEKELADHLFPEIPKEVIGAVVDCNVAHGNPQRFRERFQIHDPFILYVGRQISGKNLPLLAERFLDFKAAHPSSPLKLVLTGKGDLDYSAYSDIINLGFVSPEEKADALAAAVCLCQPSLNESFSIVIMESWLQGVPVLVHEACEVTRDHVTDSGGGYCFEGQSSFDRAILNLLGSSDNRSIMGNNGRSYVLNRYSDRRIARSFFEALEKLNRY
jgi:glycosyltransferase involved in cell wall biosynthesis